MSSSIPINPDEGHNHEQSGRGQLKVFLGYAAGVGKTYRMLEEAQQLKREGKDIVVGYFEPQAEEDTIAKVASWNSSPGAQWFIGALHF